MSEEAEKTRRQLAELAYRILAGEQIPYEKYRELEKKLHQEMYGCVVSASQTVPST